MQNESQQSDEYPAYRSDVGSDQQTTSPSQPLLNLPGILVFLIVLCVAIHVLRTYILNPEWQIWLFLTFAYFPARFAPVYFQFDLPTFISPISHTLLHGDWAHLGMNMIWLVAFGAPVAYRIGTVRSLLFWCITAVGAVVLHTAIYFGDSVPLIGASGAVSGFLGAAARFGFRSNKRNPRAGLAGPLFSPLQSLQQKGVLPFLLVWMVFNFAFGSDIFGLSGGASIAWEAHIGGLVTGFFAIGFVDRKR